MPVRIATRLWQEDGKNTVAAPVALCVFALKHWMVRTS